MTLNRNILIFTAVILCGMFFFSCETADTKNTGKVTISLPGSEAVRALNETQRNDYVSRLKYTVVCAGPGDSKIEREAQSGEAISLELAVGRWSITVAVFNKNERMIGSQTVTEFVEGGKSKRVRIDIHLDEPIYMKAEEGRLVSDKMDITVFYHHQLKENILYEFDIKYDSNIELSDLTAEIVFEESAFYLICELPEGGAQSAVVTNFNMTMEEKSEINDPEHQHVWIVVHEKESQAATCMSIGEKLVTKKCTLCSEEMEVSEDIAVDPSGHVWETLTGVPATCTEEGYGSQICEVCEKYEENDHIKPRGHHFGEKEIILPTCSTEGKEIQTCTRDGCGEEEVEIIQIDQNAHEWRLTETTQPTCTAEGEETRVCVHNAAHTEKRTGDPATGHIPGDWEVITPATETTDGTEALKCAVCNEVLNERTAYAAGTEGLVFTLIENETAYNVSADTAISGAVHIPAYRFNSVQDQYLPVTAIANEAFSGCSGLTSVTISDNVTSIGTYAFYGCSNLTDIGIPGSVISITNNAFTNCVSLSSITVDNDNTVYRSEGDCLIQIENDILVAGCKNSIIPVGVTSIGSYAFSGRTALIDITIPDSVMSIDSAAFNGCTGLTSITIPNSVISIGSSAFRGCTGLTSITIPNSVTSIGMYAFSNCTGLTSITIPNSVTSIEREAFNGCSSLTSITIPDSVTSIGLLAFSGCTGLTSITLPSVSQTFVSMFGSTATNVPASLKTVILTSGSRIPASSFHSCSGLTSITIPSSVTSIGQEAFYRCSGLTSINIPNSVTSIGLAAFSGCSSLTSITIPDSVTNIGGMAFSSCTGLTNITIPNSVTIIDTSLFSGCTGLTSIVIPTNVTSIGASAFSGCTGLTNITIPAGVTSIGAAAFNGCTGLTSITIPNGVTSIGNNTFNSCTSLTSIVIPTNVTSIGNSAFQSCTGLTNITIPAGVTSIGNSAFQSCTGLTNITIPAGVKSIENNTFNGCTSLTNVRVLATTPPTLAYNAFTNTSTTLRIEVPTASVSAYRTAGDWYTHADKIFGF